MIKTHLRFTDLQARGIVDNRTTLNRWVRDYGFPAGALVGPNTRLWVVADVEAWLHARAMGLIARPDRGGVGRARSKRKPRVVGVVAASEVAVKPVEAGGGAPAGRDRVAEVGQPAKVVDPASTEAW
mgnify:CR=1 FL=1